MSHLSREITRRQFTQRASLAVAAGVSASLSATHGDQKLPSEGYIDAHVHVWTPNTVRYPLAAGYAKEDMKPASFTPEELFAHARPSGVTRVVLIQMSFYGYDNTYMTNMIDSYPGIFSGVAVIDENENPAQTMQALHRKGVRGFRIRPGKNSPEKWLQTDGMTTMWDTAAKLGLAMCPLIDPHYLPSVSQMCIRHPETTVVVDHFGRVGIDGKIRSQDVENLCSLAKHKNAHVKVSAFYALGKKQGPYTDLVPMIRKVYDAFGADRLMWASDCPFQVGEGHNYAESIELIREHCDFLSAEDKDWILKRTAEKVYFQA